MYQYHVLLSKLFSLCSVLSNMLPVQCISLLQIDNYYLYICKIFETDAMVLVLVLVWLCDTVLIRELLVVIIS